MAITITFTDSYNDIEQCVRKSIGAAMRDILSDPAMTGRLRAALGVETRETAPADAMDAYPVAEAVSIRLEGTE